MDSLKNWVRKVLAVVLWHGWYRHFRSWDRARNGTPLKEGITAVVSAKNEAYIIKFCLESLVGVVDQVVCIDNGSDDGTLNVMHDFQLKFGHQLQIDVLHMPEALLGDCRNAGLNHTRHKWHLRWDSDMVCRTDGRFDMRQLRQKVLHNDRPRTIQLPRTNLRGDLRHTRPKEAIDPGEPILMRFGAHIRYVEYGKFDAIRVPFYYAITNDSGRYYFHCEGLKSAKNLVHRRQYFEWREAFNSFTDSDRPAEVAHFTTFKRNWNLKFWGVDDEMAVRWRFMRDFTHRLARVNEIEFGEYPAVLRPELQRPDPRFEVVHENNRPTLRIDREDYELMAYQPTQGDRAWEQERFGG